MSVTVPATDARPAVVRTEADLRMRRLLRLPVDGPRVGIFDAHGTVSRSIAISAARCLFTYIFLPVLAPVVDLSGTAGPVVGLLLGAVSVLAIVAATRRFFAADHAWRWKYAAVASAILVLLAVQAAFDVAALL